METSRKKVISLFLAALILMALAMKAIALDDDEYGGYSAKKLVIL